MDYKSSEKDDYRVVSRYYDSVVGRPLRRLRKEVCRIAGENGQLKIVDICCGTGDQCFMLNDRGHAVTGVDASHAMLEVARRKSPEVIEYIQADAANLPLTDNSFDCAVLSFAIHELTRESRDAVMSEVLRVLQPGGLLIVVDYVPPDGFLSKLVSGLIRLLEWLAGSEHYRNYRQWMKSGALPAFLAEQGFHTLEDRRFFRCTISVVAARSRSVK